MEFLVGFMMRFRVHFFYKLISFLVVNKALLFSGDDILYLLLINIFYMVCYLKERKRYSFKYN